jgi:hypothetical protein
MKIPHYKRTALNQFGFDHVLMLVVFIVLVVVAGTFYLIQEHAATTTYVELHIGSTSGSCVNGATTAGCNGTDSTDEYATMSGSNFAIKSKSGACLDDWNGGVGSNAATRTYIHSTTCYGDKNQEWNWSNHRLVNVASQGCINGLGGSTGSGTQLIVYTCNSQNDEEFFETALSGSSSPAPSTGLVQTTAKTAALVLEATKNSQGYYMCLDDYQDSSANNAEIDAYQCNDAQSQTWTAADTSTSGADEALEITIHGKCLEPANNATASGTPIEISTCTGSTSQHWVIVFGSTLTRLRSESAGTVNPECITDPNASKVNGTQLVLERCVTSYDQTFEAATPASSTSKS